LPFYAFYCYVKDFTLGPHEKCGRPPAARVLHITGHTVLAFRTTEEPSGTITPAKVNSFDVSIHAKFMVLYFKIL
jgi:hypothetical protein